MKQYQKSLIPPVENMGIHWIVKWIWAEMNRQCASQEDVAKRSGTSSSCMRKWRIGVRSPRVYEIEACVNALGYKFRIVPNDQEFSRTSHSQRPYQDVEGMLSLSFS